MTAVVACGALAGHIDDITRRNNLDVSIEALDPLLHNSPKGIAPAVEDLIAQLRPLHDTIAVAYADCGTYGALDDVCERLGVARLTGDHCYDVFATVERMRQEFETVPGTYVLTDFLVRTFERSVIAELGLDRHPELRDDYFHAYTRALWLAQNPTPELSDMADRVAGMMGLPLEVLPVGDLHLERQVLELVGAGQ